MDENWIQTIDNEAFQDNSNIVELSLKNNYLWKPEFLECLFKSSTKLESVFLESNGITELIVTEKEETAKYLKWFKDVKTGYFPLEKINIFYSGNPFLCDCSMINTFEYAQENDNVYRLHNISCQSDNYHQERIVPVDVDLMKEILDAECDFFVNLKGPYSFCVESTSYLDRRSTKTIDCSMLKLYDLPVNQFLNINYSEDAVRMLLNGNHFKSLDELFLPPNLISLNISSNEISTISNGFVTQLITLKNLTCFSFVSNPIECNCRNIEIFRTLIDKLANKISRYEDIYCNNDPLFKLKDFITSNDCNDKINLPKTFLNYGIIASIIVSFITASFTIYKYRKSINLYIFNFCGPKIALIPMGKLYDAFVSYSYRDEEFVFREIVERLENEPMPYKLCLSCRSWNVGCPIHDQILQSILKSRRTIVVLSANFIRSEWCRLELREAHSLAMDGNHWSKVIIVLYGDLRSVELDSDLRNYLRINTVIRWDDPKFCDKLRFQLRNSRRSLKLKQREIITL